MAIVQFKFMTVCQEKIQLNGFLSSRIPMNIIILSMIKPAGIIQVTTIFAIFKSSDVWQSNYHFSSIFHGHISIKHRSGHLRSVQQSRPCGMGAAFGAKTAGQDIIPIYKDRKQFTR